MAVKSKIEWTGLTWNPVRGCKKISPGCRNCYACTFAERFRGVARHPYEQGFDLRLVPEKLLEPFKWNNNEMVFVNSMSDLFLEDIGVNYVKKVCNVMVAANWHIYQVLTKRAEFMKKLLDDKLAFAANCEHIWFGVSVEDKRYGLPRIDYLRQSKAKVKFLSIEPLLEDLGQIDLSRIDWVIVGGESGRGARPMKADWVESILEQCQAANIPFFFKQWGGTNKKATGRELDGKTYDAMPKTIFNNIPSKFDRLELANSLSI
ncbi:MAG: phage Gp37/Gp68 family protein [Blastocatellia bacterium]